VNPFGKPSREKSIIAFQETIPGETPNNFPGKVEKLKKILWDKKIDVNLHPQSQGA